jgi:glycosyltransferase involved in cell wall biosynthesis
MADDMPLVTIGIPNYNYAHYIKNTLNSVAHQTYPNIELIIVDDCSTDDSINEIDNWIKNYSGTVKINFIKNEVNLGLTKSCNVILKNATGKYLQTLDADDIIFPKKIEKQVPLFKNGNNVALVYSNAEIIDESGKIIHPNYLEQIRYNENEMPQGKIFDALFEFNFIPLPSVLIDKEMALVAGGFDEHQQVQDYYMWLKLSEKHDMLYLNEKTAYYRSHQSSMSRSSKTSARSVESVLVTKYRYLETGNEVVKRIIKKDIFNSVTTLYQSKFPSAGIWLKRNAELNPGIKSFVYYISFHLGIPFRFFNTLKKIFSKVRSSNK